MSVVIFKQGILHMLPVCPACLCSELLLQSVACKVCLVSSTGNTLSTRLPSAAFLLTLNAQVLLPLPTLICQQESGA